MPGMCSPVVIFRTVWSTGNDTRWNVERRVMPSLRRDLRRSRDQPTVQGAMLQREAKKAELMA
jgi:hypothetical protein